VLAKHDVSSLWDVIFGAGARQAMYVYLLRISGEPVAMLQSLGPKLALFFSPSLIGDPSNVRKA